MFVQYVCSKQSDKTMQVIDFIDIYIIAINSAISKSYNSSKVPIIG